MNFVTSLSSLPHHSSQITRLRSGTRNSMVASPIPSATVSPFSEFSAPSINGRLFTSIKSGSIPTPWREKVLDRHTKSPLWLPQYWWTHVDFSSESYFSYDGSYDTSLLKMLPRWMQAIAVIIHWLCSEPSLFFRVRRGEEPMES